MSNDHTLPRRSLLVAGGAGALAASLGPFGPRAAATPRPVKPRVGHDLFVDPVKGDDRKRGTTPGQAVRTLPAAVEILKARPASSGDVTVWLRGGRHRLDRTLTLTALPGDPHVTWRSYPDERARITGSRTIMGWRETRVNGRRAWQTTVPALDGGEEWNFKTMFVNDERRSRPRLPESVDAFLDAFEPIRDLETQNYWFQKGTTDSEPLAFVYREGDLDPTWQNLTDIDVVATTQWITERGPLASVDPATRTARLQHRPVTKMWAGRHYYLDNVKEALRKPGQWYLDRPTRILTYLPRDRERLSSTSITAPVVEVMIDIRGTEAQPVSGHHFVDLAIGWNEWDYYQQVPFDVTDQAASRTRGAVEVRHASSISFEQVRFAHVGERALDVGRNTRDITVSRCEVAHAGSGALRAGSEAQEPDWGKYQTSAITVTDSHFHHLGEVFHNAAGVHLGDLRDAKVVYNHIHDVIYSPVSMGWTWDYTDRGNANNLIAHNHIHDAGFNFIADMAGIYVLGLQRGGRVEHNHIHHVLGEKSPSAGIYFDQGSSLLTVRDNWVHHNRQGIVAPNSSAGIDVVNNVISENEVFQVGGTGGYDAIGLGGLSEYKMWVRGNIITGVDQPLFGSPVETVRSDENLLWDFEKPLPQSGNVPLTLKLVRARDLVTVASTVVVEPVGSGTDFVYADLAAPVTLEAGERYHLSMVVESGGPTWHDAAPITTSSVAQVIGYSFFGWEGDYITAENGPVSFGPLSFRYRDADGVHDFVRPTTPSTGMRNNYGGQLGFWFQVGSEPLTVTALGNYPMGLWYQPWHDAGLDATSVVADPRYVDRSRYDYRVRADSPALRPPVNYRQVDRRFGQR